MSLHLGSSKYDEHTVRKVISKRYFKYLHPLCSICFPGLREHASLEDKARATPGPVLLRPQLLPRAGEPSWAAQQRCRCPSRSRRDPEQGRAGDAASSAPCTQGRRDGGREGRCSRPVLAKPRLSESSPLSIVTPTTSVTPVLNLSPSGLSTRPARSH